MLLHALNASLVVLFAVSQKWGPAWAHTRIARQSRERFAIE